MRCDFSFHLCGYGSIAAAEERNWEHVETTPATIGNESVFRDRVTRLMWTRGDELTTKDWEDALNYCNELDHGGYSNWGLPTQKERMDACSHGIFDLNTEIDPPLGSDLSNYFWTSSSLSDILEEAWINYISIGYITTRDKERSNRVLCVRQHVITQRP